MTGPIPPIAPVAPVAPVAIDELAVKVREIYMAGPGNAETAIEAFLKTRFGHLPGEERLAALEKLVAAVEGKPGRPPAGMPLDENLLAQISSLLLGRQVMQSGLSSEELAGRLGDSLNTIFDSLNHLIGVINKTLGGGKDNEKTIRQVIGSQLSGSSTSTPLEAHLGQINVAFLTVQRAFKEAALKQVVRMLEEIDPEQIAEESGGGFRIGPFRKAACFEAYEEKFERIQRWIESGGFMEGFLREFEKKCRELMEN